MVKVWCKFEQNRTKAIKVIEQNPYMSTEGRNDGHAENSIAPKTPFSGGIKTSPSGSLFGITQQSFVMLKQWPSDRLYIRTSYTWDSI